MQNVYIWLNIKSQKYKFFLFKLKTALTVLCFQQITKNVHLLTIISIIDLSRLIVSALLIAHYSCKKIHIFINKPSKIRH